MNCYDVVAWAAVAALAALLLIAGVKAVTGGDFRPWLYVCVFPLVVARVAFRAKAAKGKRGSAAAAG